MTVRRAALAAGLALVTLVATVAQASAPSPRRVTTEPLTTPLWSIRRAPEALARVIANRRLDRGLDAILAGSHACLVARAGSTTIEDRAATTPLAAASNQKLLIAAAALSILGPDFRFETKLVAQDAPRNGVASELWMVGVGDPMLTSPEYQAFLGTQRLDRDRHVTPLMSMVDALTAAGVRAIGTVHGDDSRYSRERTVPTWKPIYLTDHEISPLAALTVNDGFTTWKPKMTSAPDPAVYAAAEVRRLAVGHGIAVTGVADAAVAPRGAVTVAAVSSPPLSVIVADMLAESDNLAAELLVRELGVRVGHDGSTPAGLGVVSSELARLGLPVDGLHLIDGSGLDTGNRVTCRLLLAALDLGSRSPMRALRDGLPVAGRNGTLVNRLTGTPLEGRLRAKTGSIQGVVGLTGFLDAPDRLSFAFVADGSFGERAGRAMQDQVAAVLARWPEEPDPGGLVP